ncbi:MAG: DUF1538 domain-containing protein [Methanomicrobiales archaeon]|nr:DUF1538 domain-containing protein [Methanomicrobiales archaeon]
MPAAKRWSAGRIGIGMVRGHGAAAMMQDKFRGTIGYVLKAVVPIITVILFSETVLFRTPLPSLLELSAGIVMVIIGFALFLVGVRAGLLPMGNALGSELPKKGSLPLILIMAFALGFFTTAAEPDVQVLTGMIDLASGGTISRALLLAVIGAGVGFFVMVAIVRIVRGIPISYLLAAGYALVLLLSIFTPVRYLAIAFDAGGVTTGPLTVPFILAFGLGISTVLGGRSSLSDGFGLIGLASIGPILGVMALGVLVG